MLIKKEHGANGLNSAHVIKLVGEGCTEDTGVVLRVLV